MLKFVQIIKRRSDLEIFDFRRHWGEYRGRLGPLLRENGAIRVDFSTTLAVEDNLRVMTERGTGEPYDGMVEAYFENAASIDAMMENPEFDLALKGLQALQEEFMDLGRSSFFFARDEVE